MSATAATRPASAAPATRRQLRFTGLQDVVADLDALDAGGEVVGLGTWTPAQIVDHVRRGIVMSREGVDFSMPLPMRALGRLLRPIMLRARLRPGLKIPGIARDTFTPPVDLRWDDAVRAFRDEVDRASKPGAMHQRSPLFGQLSHDQWEQFQCRHAELHFSFLVNGPAT